jgi:cytochrome c-type biogenesis protein CcmF
MIIELGHYALCLALILALVQSVVPLLGAHHARMAWMKLGHAAAWSLSGLVTISFLALVHAFALSDFSVLNVATNSHTMKPLLYKITAVWGNHEGSMLLWVWMLSFWGILVVQAGHRLAPAFQARVIAVQGMIAIGFLMFVLFTSNPFARLDPAPPEGAGLNPVLQDIALAVHPPLLYMGYVGFSVAFCFAIAALLEKKIDRHWAASVRPWVLAAWVSLTGGITLGSIWAYYELGWGGFWFWDPVENAALMPWLAGTALLHSVAVLEKRDALKNWTVFLAILTFSLSLLGTFLVRSGVLTSVHAFAVDPARGVFILMLLTVATGGGLFLYALRAPYIRSLRQFRAFSRETALLLNNVFLFAVTATVFMGTLYPLFMSALDLGSVSVGTPYYTATLAPLLLPFALLMGAAPAIVWRAGNPRLVMQRLLYPALAIVAFLLFLLATPAPEKPLLLLALAAGGWIVLTLLQDVFRKTGGFQHARLPLSYYGMVVAHFGFALVIMGSAIATQLTTEKILWLAPGETVAVAGYDISYRRPQTDTGWNYNIDRAVFDVNHTGKADGFIMAPEKRWYPVANRMTSEAALHLDVTSMLYIVLGDADENDRNRFVVRIYHHPMIALLFGGAGLIALGGFLALLTRKRPLPADAAGGVV